MPLRLGIDFDRLPIEVREELEHLIAQLQTWAGKQDGAGKWMDQEYDASLFLATAGTWTVQPGDMFAYRYAVNEDVMHLYIALQSTSTDANVTNELRIKLPGGYRGSNQSTGIGFVGWNGSAANGVGRVYGAASPNDNYIRLLRDVASPSTNWPANESNALYFDLSLTMKVFRDQTL